MAYAHIKPCPICTEASPEERARVEAEGVEAMNEKKPWKVAWRDSGTGASEYFFKKHMAEHYKPPAEEAFERVFSDLESMLEDLQVAAKMAPPEVRPLYAVAMHNLRLLEETKPSQQNLILALKGIHEITGMKAQQRVLLDYARAAFGTTPAKVELPVIDAEVLELGQG